MIFDNPESEMIQIPVTEVRANGLTGYTSYESVLASSGIVSIHRHKNRFWDTIQYADGSIGGPWKNATTVETNKNILKDMYAGRYPRLNAATIAKLKMELKLAMDPKAYEGFIMFECNDQEPNKNDGLPLIKLVS